MPIEMESSPPKRSSRRKFLGLAGGAATAALGALATPRRIRAQEIAGATNLEAPLSPVDVLLANTELVDAVYLDDSSIAEFRKSIDESYGISINQSIAQEQRDTFANLVSRSGERFKYGSLIILSTPYSGLLEEDMATTEDIHIYATAVRYKGSDIPLALYQSQINEGRCILRIGFSDQAKKNMADPAFVETFLNPKLVGLVQGVLADGSLDTKDRVNRESSIFEDTKNVLIKDFFNYS